MRIPTIKTQQTVDTTEGTGILYRTTNGMHILATMGGLFRATPSDCSANEFIVHIMEDADKLDRMAVERFVAAKYPVSF